MKEGYYKFDPRYAGMWAVDEAALAELQREREKLFALKLIGAYAEGPYQGVGYGNLSVRSARGFIITATGTGRLERLAPQQYTEIVDFNLARNSVSYLAAVPGVTPSAESMTHGVLYRAAPAIRAVVHVHHLGLWKALRDVFPTSAPSIEYGTPEMGREMERLLRETDLPLRKLLVMGGHEEGIITIGDSPADATQILLGEFARRGFSP